MLVAHGTLDEDWHRRQASHRSRCPRWSCPSVNSNRFMPIRLFATDCCLGPVPRTRSRAFDPPPVVAAPRPGSRLSVLRSMRTPSCATGYWAPHTSFVSNAPRLDMPCHSGRESLFDEEAQAAPNLIRRSSMTSHRRDLMDRSVGRDAQHESTSRSTLMDWIRHHAATGTPGGRPIVGANPGLFCLQIERRTVSPARVELSLSPASCPEFPVAKLFQDLLRSRQR